MSQGTRLLDALHARPLLLDAAMSTRLIARGLDLKTDDPCLWCLDRPDEVADIHRRDVAAGSDAVLTNTFGANRKWLARFGREDDAVAINRRAVELAREAAGPERFVFGSMGPTAVEKEFASLEQATALVEAGVDALILETHTFVAAMAQVRRLNGLGAVPLVVSLNDRSLLDEAGSSAPRCRSSDGPRQLGRADGVSALGSNCYSLQDTLRVTTRLYRGWSDLPLIAKPTAGLPGEEMAAPEEFAGAVRPLLALGVRLIGGCCGTTEAHVAAMRKAIDELPAESRDEGAVVG